MRYTTEEHGRWYRRGAAWGSGAAWSFVFVFCCVALIMGGGTLLAVFVMTMVNNVAIGLLVGAMPLFILMGVADCMRRKYDSQDLPSEMPEE